jgi:hypothetical protein
MCKARIPIAIIADIVLQRKGNYVSINCVNGITLVGNIKNLASNEVRTQFRVTKSQCAVAMIERTVTKTVA